MTIEELHAEMVTTIHGLRAEMVTTIQGLRAEMVTTIQGLRAEMVATTEGLRAEMVDGYTRLEKKLRAHIKNEGKATRLHFDVMVEKMQESVRLVAEGTAHHTVRLDDHEKRIKRLEGPRRT